MDRSAGGGYPGVAPADSFASMDTRNTTGWGGSVIASVVGRRKATPEEEAALLSQATAQAMMAAKSMLLSGSSHATVIATARAAAESVLAPKGGAGGPYLSRRKAKQQAQVIASMAFMSAQNASKNQHHHHDDMSHFGGSSHPGSPLKSHRPEQPHQPRMTSGSSSLAGDSSSFRPPSVIRRDFRQDDPSTMGSHMTGVSHGGDDDTSLRRTSSRFFPKHEPKKHHHHSSMSPDASVASGRSGTSKRGARVAELLSASSPSKATTTSGASNDKRATSTSEREFDHHDEQGKSYSTDHEDSGFQNIDLSSSSDGELRSHESYSSASENSLAFEKGKCRAGSYEEDAIETFLQPLFCNFGLVPDHPPRIKAKDANASERRGDQNGDREMGSSQRREASQDDSREGPSADASKQTSGKKSDMAHLDILTALEDMEKRSGVGSPSPRRKNNKRKSKRSIDEKVQKALTPKGGKKGQASAAATNSGSKTKLPPPLPITAVSKTQSFGLSRRIRSALQIRSRSKGAAPSME